MLSETSTASEFMSKKLVTAYSNSNVSRAVKLMVDYNIGSVVISDNEGPLGLFTERDLLNNVLASGRKLEEPILMEVMSRSLNSITSNTTLIDAAKIMVSKKGRLIVIDEERPVGIITATDLVREIRLLGRRFDFNGSYSACVYQVPPRSKVNDVVKLMAEKRIGSVIVAEGRYSRGIFTERDLLRSVLSPDFRMDEPVENFATHHLITSNEGINGLEAADMMANRRIKRLPLVRDGNFISGIVTARDLVEAFANSIS